jgi:hypothetical protein
MARTVASKGGAGHSARIAEIETARAVRLRGNSRAAFTAP